MSRTGLAGVAMLIVVTHAGAADAPQQKPRIYLDIKVVATDETAKAVLLKSTRFTIQAGEATPSLREGQHELSCTADVKGDPAGDFRKLQIPVSCIYRFGDKVISSPTIVIGDGRSGLVEAGVKSGVSSFAALLSASLSEERLNEAGKLSVPQSQSPAIQNFLSGL
jgi:hypothetical protein